MVKPSIAMVGAGKVGSALALLLNRQEVIRSRDCQREPHFSQACGGQAGCYRLPSGLRR